VVSKAARLPLAAIVTPLAVPVWLPVMTRRSWVPSFRMVAVTPAFERLIAALRPDSVVSVRLRAVVLPPMLIDIELPAALKVVPVATPADTSLSLWASLLTSME